MWEMLHEYWIPLTLAACGMGGWIAYRLCVALGGAVKSEEDSDSH